MTSPIRLSRRQFVQRALAVSAAFPGLKSLGRSAEASGFANPIVLDRYGPLLRDPHRILDLPKGFRYRVISRTGDRMADGFVVPGFPDGMAAFSGRDGKVILIRNHELESKGAGGIADFFRRLGPYGAQNEMFSEVDVEKLYDPGGVEGYPSIGGTTTLVYDPDTGERVTEFLSLAGTERNCAGGVTPWGTWLTCEESNAKANGEFLADHGYVFEGNADRVFYFACTNGGARALGQIFKYTPAAPHASDGSSSPGTLELFIESTDGVVIQGVDNLTIAPWGDLIACEDRRTESHLRGITSDGKIYTFAKNALNGTEFAGACFAPDRSTLFVNIQKPGLTLAIDGPW